jgi:hypothetical protein
MDYEEARAAIAKAVFKRPAQEALISFSYHKHCIGKPEKRATGELWCGNERINLGYGWATVALTYEEVFVMLSEGGYALGPALKSDHRDKSNFQSHQLALVDIDDGMSIAQLKQLEFYQRFGSGYYTTPSHTEAAPRFRVIYRLDKPVLDGEQMRALYEGLLAIHGAADISCKDPARLFYGTVEAQHAERTQRTLTEQGTAEALQARQRVLDARNQANLVPLRSGVQYDAPDLQQVQAALDDLRKHYPDLQYAVRFKVTRAVAAHIGVPQAVVAMRTRWPDTDKTVKYEELLKDPLQSGGPTLGSVIYMIRDADPSYRKSLKQVAGSVADKRITLPIHQAPYTADAVVIKNKSVDELITKRTRLYE